MTDQQLVLQAVNEAQRILEEYLEPRPQNDERILAELVEVLERSDLVVAVSRLQQRVILRMTKQIRSVGLAAGVVAAFLPVAMPYAQAKQQCNLAMPSNPHSSWWSYRIIDGRKCWYEGAPGWNSVRKSRALGRCVMPMMGNEHRSQRSR